MLVAMVVLVMVLNVPAQAQRPSGGPRASDTLVVSLNDVVRAALAQNLQLLSAAADTRGAASRGTAVRSRFDPVLRVGGEPASGEYGGQIVGGLPTGGSYLVGSIAPSTLPGEPLYPNALVASVRQPLFRGLGPYSVGKSIHAVDEGIAASRARLARVRDVVVSTIAIDYALLVERHRQEAIARRSLQRAESLLAAYTELYAIQKIAEVDLTTARLGVVSRRATLLEVEGARVDAQDALLFAAYGARAAAALASDNTVIIPRDTALAIPALPALDAATTRALAVRPDVEAARRTAAQAHYRASYARNASLPALDLSAAVTRTLGDSLQRLAVQGSTVAPGRVSWFIGLEFSRPLRNSAADAELERLAAEDTQSQLAVTDAENIARADVRAAYRDIARGRERLRLASEASRLASLQYDGERARLDLGLTDLFRVLQYEEQVSQVERAEAAAWLSLATAVARYKTAVGVASAEYGR